MVSFESRPGVGSGRLEASLTILTGALPPQEDLHVLGKAQRP